ncbi:Mpo1 family 2-hydroxy fatty acid dioxygenase [Luteibaculum oceani]|uniref:DUF962 domain-containing protein n=1 Tax=Luteibaculum oceani TaxID=1294296 RepID=A0A5C6UZA3_9FLAO|nr:Mpo1-like protein [Luteibaculum oceani]TXC78597.1 DUF962 domain-containing protein [Luteibaculum oceani]
MKSANQWFSEYGESHQNATNKLIHWICVPSIFFSIVGLLAAIPHSFLDQLVSSPLQPYMHWGTVLIIIGSIFYLLMSIPLFIGMLGFSALVLWLCAILESSGLPIGLTSFIIFVVAWIGQFIGHKIEGKKPSFFKDVQFLLIGPAWLMHFIYKKIGIPY